MIKWDTKLVECPFFRKHDSNRIVCEGLSKVNTLHLVFGSSTDKKLYMKDRCNDMYRCRQCPIHSLLQRKYEE